MSRTTFACLLVLAIESGCGGSSQPFKNTPQEGGQTTLYQRIGGGPAVAAIADQLADRVIADPNVNFARAGHPHTWSPTPGHVAELKTYLAQYIGMICDGPQVYEGRNLLDVHRGMQISESEWYAFMDDLKSVLASSQIAWEDQNEVLRRVGGSRDVIVDK
ncbi:MAG TPA: group 1 truncated hemoglobin [Tepidisphaeraceae bacterium]|jgi:hemoglobin|nr:group 1 truncated hemoglobin [Tepidisphaeraceae bacterium]